MNKRDEKLVWHIIHITAKTFDDAESLRENLINARDSPGRLWCGLRLMSGVEIKQLGRGLYAQFVDPNLKDDLVKRINLSELAQYSRIDSFSFIPHRCMREILNHNNSLKPDFDKRSEEIPVPLPHAA